MNSKLFFSAVAAATTLATQPAAAQTTESAGLLRDSAGKTLYIFDKDAPNESRCYDGCAAAWPPFLAGDAAKASGRLALVARKGGGRQWVWDDKPLYYYAGDTQPGQVTGDRSGGVWHVVRPAVPAKKQSSVAGAQGDPYKY